ncbi:hypothetical protein [Paraburkholderia sp. DGU8]|uniref:hypothetical protein n=1 Tax=Paraburkholderia sp. DGU8 TaxID=3161997 RepID=UPI003466AB22
MKGTLFDQQKCRTPSGVNPEVPMAPVVGTKLTPQLVAATASIADFGNDASTNNQTMVMPGIRHHF